MGNHREEKWLWVLFSAFTGTWMDHQGNLETWKVGCGHRASQSSWFPVMLQERPKSRRQMYFLICSFNIMSLFSADDFVEENNEINIEKLYQWKRDTQGKNLRSKQQGLSCVVCWLWLPFQSKGMQVWFLVGELRSPCLGSHKPKQKTGTSLLKFNKDF